jgi:hypothetical protein
LRHPLANPEVAGHARRFERGDAGPWNLLRPTDGSRSVRSAEAAPADCLNPDAGPRSEGGAAAGLTVLGTLLTFGLFF